MKKSTNYPPVDAVCMYNLYIKRAKEDHYIVKSALASIAAQMGRSLSTKERVAVFENICRHIVYVSGLVSNTMREEHLAFTPETAEKFYQDNAIDDKTVISYITLQAAYGYDKLCKEHDINDFVKNIIQIEKYLNRSTIDSAEMLSLLDIQSRLRQVVFCPAN